MPICLGSSKPREHSRARVEPGIRQLCLRDVRRRSVINQDHVVSLLPEWFEVRNNAYELAREMAICLRNIELYKSTHLDDLALGASASPVLMVVMATSDDPEVCLAIARRKSFLGNGKIVSRLLCDENERVRLASLKYGITEMPVIRACPEMFRTLRFVDALTVFVGALFYALPVAGWAAAVVRGGREEFRLGEGIARSMGLTVIRPT